MPESTHTKERIGFVGVGMMGSGMCANLLDAGYHLTVIANRNRERIEALVTRGATEAKTFEGLANASDVVMICVNSADTVRAIVGDLKPALRPGMMVIDITTSLPEVTRDLADELSALGVTFIDAPVIGGPSQAHDGTLGTFIGGSDEAVARAMPIVSSYSADVPHFGSVSAGHTAKLINNYLTVGYRQLVTHVFKAARRNDIDIEKLYNVISKGAAPTRILDQFAQGAIDGDYTRNKFSIGNCHKDISYAEDIFSADPDGAAIQQVMRAAYGRLVEAGLGDHVASEMLDPDLVKKGSH